MPKSPCFIHFNSGYINVQTKIINKTRPFLELRFFNRNLDWLHPIVEHEVVFELVVEMTVVFEKYEGK